MTSPPTLVLRAPLSGILVPLDEVPDAVFAQRLVGDGVSIDPTSSTLLAPCAGRIAHVHGAGHALTIRTPDGVEVMMHVGLDTVKLRGEGFRALVHADDQVECGRPVIEFDADYVATHARSLLTQILVTTPERVASVRPRTGPVRAGEDVVADVVLRADGAGGADTPNAGTRADAAEIASDDITIRTATGLHARPAAVLANAAKAFAGDVFLVRGTTRANAKSVVAIMGLEVGAGDRVRIVARGPEAPQAVAHLAPLLASGLGDEVAPATPSRERERVSDRSGAAGGERARADASTPPDVLAGVGASPGVAVGRVFRLRAAAVAIQEYGGDPRTEQRHLERAIDHARAQLQQLQGRMRADADAAKAGIFAAQEALLADPELLDLATSAIAAGKSAGFAWQRAYTAHANRLAGLSNELLAGRANDLRDVGTRVLRALAGESEAAPAAPPGSILVADDLTPSDTASLDRSRVLGFCTSGGGATSHVAILARALALPAVVAIDPRALDLEDGTPVVLDGAAGTLRLHPDAEEVARIERRQHAVARRRADDLAAAHAPAITRDGVRIEVAGNIGALADVEPLVQLGGEGVGLLRSEFLFLGRASAPTEDEQAATYGDIAAGLGPGRSLIVRALDVGGDKPLPYLPAAREENPFLGERGIRLLLNRPDLLRAQLRAVLRAAPRGTVRIMFPMIARLEEWREVKALLEEERTALGAPAIPAGIMVEVPSAAVLAPAFAREVDFFSIGTNDLTQYTIAMDRAHPKLAASIDGLDPSVLHLVARTVDAARNEGKWVGVCGGIAADAQAIPLLVGLGVDELSVSVPAIPAVKAHVRRLDAGACRDLARRALAAGTASEVRALVPLEDE